MKTAKFFAASALAVISSTAMAKSQTGTFGDVAWKATSRIIGQTPTGPSAGGNPIYFAPNSAGYSGTVGILTTYANGDQFVCSGTLTNSRTIVSAAHCVSSGNGVKDRDLVRTQIVFSDQAASASGNSIYAGVAAGTPGPGITVIDASYIKVNPNYTGEVIDQNDIAVIRLASAAPASAQRYSVYYGGNLTGQDFNVAGYGLRSTIGGACGTADACISGTGRRRQADNRYDFAFGDADFGGFFTDGFFGDADVTYSFVSDFDNGLAANDASCAIADAFGLGGAKYCNLGRGLTEGSIAGGDSGGPGFIDGKLASVNSYGLSFGSDFGDLNDDLDDTFGEFAGYVPTYIHQGFLQGVANVPEPSQWALMLGGFGMLGGAMRRRRARVSVTYA